MTSAGRLKQTLVGLVVLFMIGGTVVFMRTTVFSPSVGHSLEEDDRLSDFRLVVSRYGMPGEPETHWTISEHGEVVKEKVDRTGAITQTTKLLVPDEVKSLRALLTAFEVLDEEYIGTMAIHDNLGLTLFQDENLYRSVSIMNRPQLPEELIQLLRALDAVLGTDFKIGYP